MKQNIFRYFVIVNVALAEFCVLSLTMLYLILESPLKLYLYSCHTEMEIEIFVRIYFFYGLFFRLSVIFHCR